MIGINNLLSWLENWPRNWTNNKLQAIALKGLFNICLLIEVNHITSQPSLPKKIKSPPRSVLSRWVLGICLQSVLPTKAETFTPLQDRRQCASVVFLVFFCCLFLEAVVWKTEVIVCVFTAPGGDDLPTLFFSPSPPQTNKHPSCQLLCPWGRPFLSLLTSWLSKTSFLFAFSTAQGEFKNFSKRGVFFLLKLVEADWNNCLIFFILICPEWEKTIIFIWKLHSVVQDEVTGRFYGYRKKKKDKRRRYNPLLCFPSYSMSQKFSEERAKLFPGVHSYTFLGR